MGQTYCALPPLCFTLPSPVGDAHGEPDKGSIPGLCGKASGEAYYLGLSAAAPQVKGASSLDFTYSYAVLEPDFVSWRMGH
jgi:hypothetical protein